MGKITLTKKMSAPVKKQIILKRKPVPMKRKGDKNA